MNYKLTYKILYRPIQNNDYVIEDHIVIYKIFDISKIKKDVKVEPIQFILICLDNDDIIEIDPRYNDIFSSLLNFKFNTNNMDKICVKCKGRKFLKTICPNGEQSCNYSVNKDKKFLKIKNIVETSKNFDDLVDKLEEINFKFVK